MIHLAFSKTRHHDKYPTSWILIGRGGSFPLSESDTQATVFGDHTYLLITFPGVIFDDNKTRQQLLKTRFGHHNQWLSLGFAEECVRVSEDRCISLAGDS